MNLRPDGHGASRTARQHGATHGRSARRAWWAWWAWLAAPALCAAQQVPVTPAAALAVAGDPAGLASAMPTAIDPLPPANRDVFTYALGGSLGVAPAYAGGGSQQLKIKPLLAVRYGRFRVSSSGAAGLLSEIGDAASGASADLLDNGHLKIGAALRFDSGRQSSDDVSLSGLPDIERTLRGRVYGSLDIGAGWSSYAGYSHDLLGRGGGGLGNLGVGYGWVPWRKLETTVTAGISWADGQHMRTYFGIAPAVALATGRTAFVPSASLRDVHAGAGFRLPLEGRWLLFGGVAVSQLQGDAAASPLTKRATSIGGTLAVAWRSR